MIQSPFTEIDFTEIDFSIRWTVAAVHFFVITQLDDRIVEHGWRKLVLLSFVPYVNSTQLYFG